METRTIDDDEFRAALAGHRAWLEPKCAIGGPIDLFGRAHFMDTKLIRANLRDCHTLSESNFINSDLTDADVRGADTFQALFTQSTMLRAKFTDAKLDECNFEHADGVGRGVHLA